MSKATEFLNNHQSATPSKWRESAEWRRENEKWLKYARFITMKTMQAMDRQGDHPVRIGRADGMQPTICFKPAQRQFKYDFGNNSTHRNSTQH